MSSALVSSPYTTGVEEGSRRRSLFKPSTWKNVSKKSRGDEVHDGLAPAGIDAPTGDAVTGLNTIDGVETGAPLTALAGESAAQPVERAPGGAGTGIAVLDPHGTNSIEPTSSGLSTTVDTLGRITFFRQDQPNFHLSNSSTAYPVTYNNVRYPTAEHLFQSLKFPNHPEVAAKVRRSKTPLDAMRIARSHTNLYPPGWFSEGLNVKIMHQVVLAKFSQYSALTQALLETEEREIVNASPTDVFWGQGGGTGKNVLGKSLMEVREVLRNVAGVGLGSGAKTM